MSDLRLVLLGVAWPLAIVGTTYIDEDTQFILGMFVFLGVCLAGFVWLVAEMFEDAEIRADQRRQYWADRKDDGL